MKKRSHLINEIFRFIVKVNGKSPSKGEIRDNLVKSFPGLMKNHRVKDETFNKLWKFEISALTH